LAALSKKLQQKQIVKHVALAHHETTTGRLNPLREVQAICAQYGASVLVDGVSSFGAEAIDFNAGIAACAATANKCLHGVPGISFAIVRRSALADSKRPARSVYLDLAAYCEAQDRGGTPFTQSVQVMYALAEALQEMSEQGGWQARHAHYAALMQIVRDGLVQLGVQPLLEDGASSVVLNSFVRPQGLSYESLHHRLKERGFVIYAGQGALAVLIFRVAVMGAINDADMQRFVESVKSILAGELIM
jgi:2-aminoethylphosphonate-pyruvate transaminase